jgi:hypothetical protein
MKPFQFLAIVPCAVMLIGPVVHNKLHPFILDMPFPLGWVTVWIVLTAATMALVYAIDPANKGGDR